MSISLLEGMDEAKYRDGVVRKNCVEIISVLSLKWRNQIRK